MAGADWDLSTGDLQLTTGLAAIRQAVYIHLSFFRGEWFLDREAGVPYFADVLKKNPNPNVLQSVFRRALLEVTGITSVDSMTVAQSPATRTAELRATCSTDAGLLEIVQPLGA